MINQKLKTKIVDTHIFQVVGLPHFQDQSSVSINWRQIQLMIKTTTYPTF